MLSRETDSDFVRGSGWLLATRVGLLRVWFPEFRTPTTSCRPAHPTSRDQPRPLIPNNSRGHAAP